MKAINARRNIFSFVIVVFPHCNDVGAISVIHQGMCQMGVKMELTYFDMVGKNKDEGTQQDSKTASPFVVCKVGDDISTLPELRGCLKSFKAVQGNCKDEDGSFYQRQKPVDLYADLIDLFGQSHTWMMDACSGAGSAAIASIESSCNVVVIEQKEERCRMIKRRLQAECNK